MTELDIALKAMRTYAECHPRPVHVTQKQAAEMIGLSVPTVRKMLKSGLLSLNACGLIPISQIDKAIEG